MKESTEKFIEDVAKGDKCKDWKIVSVYDREDKEGIYAVMIDTGNGNSIIAYENIIVADESGNIFLFIFIEK